MEREVDGTQMTQPVKLHKLQTKRHGIPLPEFTGLGLSVPEAIARLVGGRGAYFVPELTPEGDILYRRIK